MTEPVDTPLIVEFCDWIADRLGLRFESGQFDFLGEVLQRRSVELALTAEAYLARIGEDASELDALAAELTVGETYFFRDGDQFRALAEIVLPELLQREPSRPIKILSAGCSSGEEAYTIRMVADAVAPAAQVSILGVDINPVALRKAGRARYGNWSLRETPTAVQRRYFVRQGREMVLVDTVRDAVRFKQRNLVSDDCDIWVPQTYDVIFCRNVIMYFSMATQRAVIDRIAQSLAPGGYLFLGHAETLRGLSDAFSLVQTHHTFFHELKLGGTARRPRRLPSRAGENIPAAASPTPSPDTAWFDAIASSSRRVEVLSRSTKSDQLATPKASWEIEAAFDLLRQERFAEAIACVDRAPPELAGSAILRLLRAVLLVQEGRLEDAAEGCQALLADGELTAEANHVLALCHEGRGETREALRHYGLAARLDPQFAMPRFRGGVLARRSGLRAEARAHLDAASILLQRETASRVLLFGGGFGRAALVGACAAELRRSGVAA